MAEPILQRVYRILNARVEDAIDRMERSGSDSVMREAIRAPSPSACVKQSQRIASGVAILVQWRMEAQRQQANAIRAEKIGNYQLGAERAEMYDDCLDTLRDKQLTNGGAKELFCGCFARSAIQAGDGGKNATDALKRLVDIAAGGHGSLAVAAKNRDESYFSTLAKVSTAFIDCAEDQRHSFASPAALNTWRRGKPDRAADCRCQHR